MATTKRKTPKRDPRFYFPEFTSAQRIKKSSGFGPRPDNLAPVELYLDMRAPVLIGCLVACGLWVGGWWLALRHGWGYPLPAIDTSNLWPIMKVALSWGRFGMSEINPAYLSHELVQGPWLARQIVVSLVATAGSLGVVALLWNYTSCERHSRGQRLRVGKDAEEYMPIIQKSLMEDGHKVFWKIHPYVSITKRKATTHMLITGSTGAGKSVVLLPIIDQILGTPNGRSLIYDVKGDFINRFMPSKKEHEQRCAILSPYDARSVIWDIGRELYEKRVLVDEFCNSMLPSKSGGEGAFWENAGRDLMKTVIVQLIDKYKGDWGWRLLHQSFITALKDNVAYMKAKVEDPTTEMDVRNQLQKTINMLGNPDDKTAQGIMSTVTASIKLITDLDNAWGNHLEGTPEMRQYKGYRGFTFYEWSEHPERLGPERNLLMGAATSPELTAAWCSTLVNILSSVLINIVADDELGRDVAIVLDEFPTLGKINWQGLYSVGRSRGVCMIIGIQNPEQVAKVYGKEDLSTLLGQAGIRIHGRDDAAAAKSTSELFETNLKLVTKISTSFSSSGKSVSFSTEEQAGQVIPATMFKTELGRDFVKKEPRIRMICYFGGGDPVLLGFPTFNKSNKAKPRIDVKNSSQQLPAVLRKEQATTAAIEELLANEASQGPATTQTTRASSVATAAAPSSPASARAPAPVSTASLLNPVPEPAPDTDAMRTALLLLAYDKGMADGTDLADELAEAIVKATMESKFENGDSLPWPLARDVLLEFLGYETNTSTTSTEDGLAVPCGLDENDYLDFDDTQSFDEETCRKQKEATWKGARTLDDLMEQIENTVPGFARSDMKAGVEVDHKLLVEHLVKSMDPSIS